MNDLYRHLFEDYQGNFLIEDDPADLKEKALADKFDGDEAQTGKDKRKIYFSLSKPETDDNFASHKLLARGTPYY